MKQHRRQVGASLALIAACVVVIVIIGVAFFFVMRIMGGGKELQNACDAGALGVTKQATIQSPTPTPTDDIYRSMSTLTVGTNSTGVNLLNFNRLVGQALLVALNAEADGSAGAIANANSVIQQIEYGQNSYGALLQQSLMANNGTPPVFAQNSFMSTAAANSLRMLGGSSIQWNAADYQVGYLEQKATDTGLSNVITSNIDSNLPYTNVLNSARVPTPTIPSSGGGSSLPYDANSTLTNQGPYMSGYKPINVATGIDTIYGVPVQPDQQPHLVSYSLFSSANSQPGLNTVVLPPNAFQCGATCLESRSNANTHLRSVAEIGTQNAVSNGNNPGNPNTNYVNSNSGTTYYGYQVSMPQGYIVIDNSQSATYGGQTPNTDNVFAAELGTGIYVDNQTGMFSSPYDVNANLNEPGNVAAWEGLPLNNPPTAANYPGASGTWPSYQGIFDSNGNALSDTSVYPTPLAAATAAYGMATGQGTVNLTTHTMMGSNFTTCTDQNSDPPGTGGQVFTSGSTPNCPNYTDTNSTPGDVFDKAFHPGSGAAISNSPGGVLTAAEAAKCQIINDYGNVATGTGNTPTAAYATAYSSTFNNGGSSQPPYPSTGIRLFPTQFNYMSARSSGSLGNYDGTVNGGEVPYVPPSGGTVQPAGGFGMASSLSTSAASDGAGSYSNGNNMCQVTTDGTMYQYIEQTTYYPNGGPSGADGFNASYPYYANSYANGTTPPTCINPATSPLSAGQVGSAPNLSPADETTAFLMQRLQEMCPPPPGSAPPSTYYDSMCQMIGCPNPLTGVAPSNPQTIALGHKYYIFVNSQGVLTMERDDNPSLSLNGGHDCPQCSTTYFSTTLTNQEPDGCQRSFSSQYNAWGFINSTNEWNIHDQLFTLTDATATCTDTCTYQASCGIHNMLCLLKFTENVCLNAVNSNNNPPGLSGRD